MSRFSITRAWIRSVFTLLGIGALAASSLLNSFGLIPVTSQHPSYPTAAVKPLDTLNDFIQEVATGDSQEIVGIYSPLVFALAVVDQPANQPAWVADQDGVTTRFDLATQFGSIGLLAHYEHAGKAFYRLQPHYPVTIIYGDGRIKTYRVKEIRYYQAEEPSQASTSFITIDETHQKLSQEEVFNQIYRSPDRLVLQTCLVGQGSLTWGRMFVIAEPETE